MTVIVWGNFLESTKLEHKSPVVSSAPHPVLLLFWGGSLYNPKRIVGRGLREGAKKMLKPIGIVLGSFSDLKRMEKGLKRLEALEVPFEITIASAHRTPKRLVEWLDGAPARGVKVIIAGAGAAAHLPGVVASKTLLPVIGLPFDASPIEGLDALYAIVQMPPGIPVATVDELASADAVIFGTPTRFGNMCGQMRQFLDATGQLWASGALVGKVGSVFASSATQHGGQESTILSFHITLLHHGFVVVGLPYSFQGQMRVDEITGGSPYGASTIAGGDGSRMPSENELEAARFQGKHVAEIAAKLTK